MLLHIPTRRLPTTQEIPQPHYAPGHWPQVIRTPFVWLRPPPTREELDWRENRGFNAMSAVLLAVVAVLALAACYVVCWGVQWVVRVWR